MPCDISRQRGCEPRGLSYAVVAPRTCRQRRAAALCAAFPSRQLARLLTYVLHVLSLSGSGAGLEDALAALEPVLEGLDVDAVYVDALLAPEHGAGWARCIRLWY